MRRVNRLNCLEFGTHKRSPDFVSFFKDSESNGTFIRELMNERPIIVLLCSSIDMELGRMVII